MVRLCLRSFTFVLLSQLTNDARKSFEASIGRAQQAMIDLSLHVAKNKALFDEMAVFPTAEFPGRTQEGLLGQLLRKKLEPSVEDIVAQGLESGQAAQPLASAAEQDKFCDFAEDVVVQAVNEREWAADYTLEEHEMGIENVVTGLQRKLHDPYRNEGEDVESEQNSEQSSDAEPEDEMELVDIHRKPSGVGVEIDVRKDTEGKVAPLQERPQMPLAEQLKFLTTGALPRG